MKVLGARVRLEATPAAQVMVDAQYASYVRRQSEDVATLKRDEADRIPADFPYATLPSLSNEVRTKLERQRPATLAEAAAMDGMTPAGLLLLRAALRKSTKPKTGSDNTRSVG